MEEYKVPELEKAEDEALAIAAQEGDRQAEETLLRRYQGFVAYKVKDYFLQGGDRDDLLQEGMIGLYKGIRNYRLKEGSSFCSFAELCIRRHVISAIRTANRLKNQPLNNYLSFSDPQGDEDGRELEDFLESKEQQTPEEILLGKEQLKRIEGVMKEKLSPLEWAVFYDYLRGESMLQIAREMNLPPKAVYNAMDRSRRKMGEVLAAEEIL